MPGYKYRSPNKGKIHRNVRKETTVIPKTEERQFLNHTSEYKTVTEPMEKQIKL